jgi:glycosyltransferase involved in cell wall biosynthesis
LVLSGEDADIVRPQGCRLSERDRLNSSGDLWMYRIALALMRGPSARRERLHDPTGERAPRPYVFDQKFLPVWDETLLDNARTDSRGPEWWRFALEIHARRDEYDAIVTWGERLSLALTIVQRFARSRKPHIAMMGQFAKPNTQVPLRLFGRSLHAIITWSSVQRRYLIERLGFPSERVYLVRHFVDQLFYSPRAAEEDTICSVGAEMRDYPTLIEAMRGTDLRCHIAADHVRIPHRIRLVTDRRVPVDTLAIPGDAQVTIGRKTLLELRELYARSRFVVVPLVPSDSDNGVTVILEAMAMGKPVICSRTRGQIDVIEDGVSGIYAPVGDPAALREAILSLWNEPQRAHTMGARARAYVEQFHTLEQFALNVRAAAEASLEGRPAPDSWWTGERALAGQLQQAPL